MNDLLLRLKFSQKAIDALEELPLLEEAMESLYLFNLDLLRQFDFDERILLELLSEYPEAFCRVDFFLQLKHAEDSLGVDWDTLILEDYIRKEESLYFQALQDHDPCACDKALQKIREAGPLSAAEWMDYMDLDDRMLPYLEPELFSPANRRQWKPLMNRAAAELGEGWQEVIWQDFLQNEYESTFFNALMSGEEQAFSAAMEKLRRTFSMIYLAGDTHGHQQRLLDLIREQMLMAGDLLIVLGDFSFLYRNDERENAFLDRLEREQSCTIAFIDGNHENFPAIYAYPQENWCGGKIHRIRKNIVHLMRGQVFQFRDRKFFTMGGAYSVDRYLPDKSFWEQELPCSAEYHEAIRNLERHGYEVDYILTHTAPEKMILEMGLYPDPHERELNGFLEHIRRSARHYRWFCGHWHPHEYETDHFKVVNNDVVVL